MDKEEHFDCLVIGAGISGLDAAYHLQKHARFFIWGKKLGGPPSVYAPDLAHLSPESNYVYVTYKWSNHIVQGSFKIDYANYYGGFFVSEKTTYI